MSEQVGVSQGYVDGQISRLESRLERHIDGQISQLQRYVDAEIAKLEREMERVGEMIVHAIRQQTGEITESIDQQKVAVVAGVAATTLMLERTKQKIEEEFETTIQRIEQQTESALQMELGKKMASAGAIKGKLLAFIGDVRSRFDRALLNVNINRELYTLNFNKILDDFDCKVKTIGSHILQIRDEDIAPAVEAASFPQEVTHSLPIEVDLKRLEARSRNLDDTLLMLKNSRLDEVTSSLDRLDSTLNAFSLETNFDSTKNLVVEGIAVDSPGSASIISGHTALLVAGDEPINLQSPLEGLEVFSNDEITERVMSTLTYERSREASEGELVALEQAASRLAERGLLSQESVALLGDFLKSGSLKIVEGRNDSSGRQ
jgi:23S rRNA pseudoU1915 N3-methylase RlmH